MPSTSPTKPGTRRLSEVTKHLVLPSGIAATGYPSVERQCRKMGVVHDDWQRALSRAVLAKRETGLYAAGVGGIYLSTCRQVGKTYTFGSLIFALCALTPGTVALWTAHHTRTSDETYESLVAMARRPLIAPYIAKTPSGNGRQAIVFTNGSRIMFGAREHGFGRGIPGVSIVVFDEAQILKQAALNDMIPAANTVKNPLILYMGTPPDPKDPAEVFKSRRREALRIEKARADGDDATSNMLYVEIGADDGANPDDEKQRRKGNPSYPQRTPLESIMRLREQLGDDAAFVREGLGVWDRDDAAARLITETEWSETQVDEAPDGVRSFGVAFSADGERQSVGGVVKHDAGAHVELIGSQTGSTDAGITALVRWFTTDPAKPERWRTAARITISGRSHANLLWQALREAGVPAAVLHVATTSDYFTSCSMLYDGIVDHTVTHPASPEPDALDDAAAVCDRLFRGKDGAWGWKPTTTDGDETPLEAVGLALWGARTAKRQPGRKQVLV